MHRRVTTQLPRPNPKPESEQGLLKHLPMVRFLARKIHRRLPQNLDINDLYSAGVIGLIEANAKFDSTKNVGFLSFAQFRIRGAILDSLRALDWAPRELRHKGRVVQDTIRTLTSRIGHAPAEDEVAAEMKTSLTTYQHLLGELNSLEIGSLHKKRNEDSDEEELAYVPGRPEDDSLFICMKGEMAGRLTSAIEDLPEQERLVATLYYYEELTRSEIGLALGMSGSRVQQIRTSAVLHLRSALSDFAARGAQSVPRLVRRPVLAAAQLVA